MLPAKIEKPRKWIAGPSGEIAPYQEQCAPAKKLSVMQQHAAMRVALAQALHVLTEHGFKTNCIEQSTCAISLSFHGMNFDATIRQPERIAYVTSVPNDNRKRRVIGTDRFGQPLYDVGPGVRLASDEIRSGYIVQIVASKISSLNPIFIDLPPGEPNPVSYVLKNILLYIANVVRDENLLAQAETDTSTMKRAKLPEWMTAELKDAFQALEITEG